jgi:hypothetical protein
MVENVLVPAKIPFHASPTSMFKCRGEGKMYLLFG